MLRKIRIAIASLCFVFITLLFLDFTGTLHKVFNWLAEIQFIPAVLAMNFVIVLGLAILTIVLGRIYCSVICPLGVFQDVVSWIAAKRTKHRFAYKPALLWLRYGVFIFFVGLMLAGGGLFAAFISPYSAYGRIVSNLFAPLYQWGNNLLAFFAERAGSYAFYSVDVWIKSLTTFLIATVTLVVILFLAWRRGRLYCNSICPVGTILGFLSRFAILKARIDVSKCNGCSLCARNCKAECIDAKTHTIDYSRCVVCLDCVSNCRNGAIEYSLPRKERADANVKEKGLVSASSTSTGISRRKVLSMATVFAFASAFKVQADDKKRDGGLAVLKEKLNREQLTPILPVGARDIRHFSKHCTSCQLCVSVCPNQVLRPSKNAKRWMQPEMFFERGYCRPECTQCADVCPTNAILRIKKEDKVSTQIGHAVWVKDLCVVNAEKKKCDACARHCPNESIQMVPSDANNPGSLKIPVIDVERCIGCGACEYVCPSRPYSAIYVVGHESHRIV